MLVTLGIIGVVAAMTLPSLVAHYKEKQTVIALKKFYSILEQAILLSQVENPDDYSGANVMSKFKTLKVCAPYNQSCATMKYRRYNGDREASWGKNDASSRSVYYAQLVDGSIIRYAPNNDCSVVRGTSKALQNQCAEISVDVNGNKLPNQMGKDVFFFNITKYGIIPFGTEDEKNYTFSRQCIVKTEGGKGCAAWVLTYENMDYLHCNDLRWGKKTKCK